MFSISEKVVVEIAPGNLRYEADKGFSFCRDAYVLDDADNDSSGYSATMFYASEEDGTRVLKPYCKCNDAISLGGSVHEGLDEWRVLTAEEWSYLFLERPASVVCGQRDARFLRCTVCGTPGVLLFPDVFKMPDEVQTIHRTSINNINTQPRRYKLGYKEWVLLRHAGCAFLPAAGFGEGDWYGDMEIQAVNKVCSYWTATVFEKGGKVESQNCFVLGTREPYMANPLKCGVTWDNLEQAVNTVRLVREVSSEQPAEAPLPCRFVLSIDYVNDVIYNIPDTEELLERFEIDVNTDPLYEVLEEYGGIDGIAYDCGEDRCPYINSIECLRLITCENVDDGWMDAVNPYDEKYQTAGEFTENDVDFTPAFYEPLQTGLTFAGTMPKCQNNFELQIPEGEVFDPHQLRISNLTAYTGADMDVEYAGKKLRFLGMGQGDEDRNYFEDTVIYLDGEIVK